MQPGGRRRAGMRGPTVPRGEGHPAPRGYLQADQRQSPGGVPSQCPFHRAHGNHGIPRAPATGGRGLTWAGHGGEDSGGAPQGPEAEAPQRGAGRQGRGPPLGGGPVAQPPGKGGKGQGIRLGFGEQPRRSGGRRAVRGGGHGPLRRGPSWGHRERGSRNGVHLWLVIYLIFCGASTLGGRASSGATVGDDPAPADAPSPHGLHAQGAASGGPLLAAGGRCAAWRGKLGQIGDGPAHNADARPASDADAPKHGTGARGNTIRGDGNHGMLGRWCRAAI